MKSVVRPNVESLISVPCPTIISASLTPLSESYLNFTKEISHQEEQDCNQINKITVKIKLIINTLKYIACAITPLKSKSLSSNVKRILPRLTGFIA